MRFSLFALFLLFASSAQAETLQILTNPPHTIQIEVMDDERSRARGMMHRESWGNIQGMLFLYDSPRPIAMWMKNTPLPLDMLFLDEGGKVLFIKENATPYSTAIIQGPHRTFAVLELPAGFVHTHQLKIGDEIEHPNFK